MIEHTWDDGRLQRDRLVQLQAAMQRQGVGAIYLNDTVDVRYALNTYIPGGHVFVPVEGDPIVFVRPLDDGYVRLAHPDVRPHIYRADPSDPEGDQKALRFADALAGLMAEYGVGGEPLAIGKCDPAAFLGLHEKGLRLVYAQRVLELAKEVKTPDEVLIYWEMGKLYTEIMAFFRDQLRPGLTEEEVSRRTYARAIELGAEGLLQINVCSGENMNPWRRLATDRRMQEGDLVGLDLHIYGPRGYIYDSARTYLCGSKKTDTLRDLYRRAHEYNNALIGLLRVGLPIADFRASLPPLPEEFREAVYSYHIAHSNGLTPGEYPSLMMQHQPLDDVLKENQALSVDCYFGRSGDGLAVKLEELVLLTPEGAVKMADMPYEDQLLS